ncbi:uncharacterized protein LOC143030993 isoform X1 [Oratosquilla oratoria]|uniref:uncharacterized protein LOC143030993 isoform X1 n=1 Tax=Oratosquilla oratoria TaxID=337810 RepID=UPI003F75AB90
MAESGQAWPLGTKSSKEHLQYPYTTGECSNLDIVFPAYETTFKVHRVILSMASPVFGTMKTELLAPGKELLLLPEDSPQVFRKLLDHIYMDRMELESVEEALEVYKAAYKYQMESSKKRCLQYITSKLNENITLELLETSVLREDEAMNKKCKKILSGNADSVMSSETLLRLSKETLRDLLKDDTMNFSSEVALFKGLIAWGKARLQPQKQSGSDLREIIGDLLKKIRFLTMSSDARLQHQKQSGSDLREIMGDLLKEIRFLTMSSEEFIKNVIDTNVFSHKECIDILKVISGADPSIIPEGTPLNPSRVKRYPKFRSMEDLYLCKLDSPGVDQHYTSQSNIGLIENLSCNKTIEVHYFKVCCGGTINIMDNRGEVVGSTTSKNGLFTFIKPVVLQKDKQYEVMFAPFKQFSIPKIKINSYANFPGPVLHDGKGTINIGNLTFSFLRGHNCEFYFWESTSS